MCDKYERTAVGFLRPTVNYILEISLSLLGLYSSALHGVSIVEVRRGGRFDPRIRRLFVDLIESVLNGWIGK